MSLTSYRAAPPRVNYCLRCGQPGFPLDLACARSLAAPPRVNFGIHGLVIARSAATRQSIFGPAHDAPVLRRTKRRAVAARPLVLCRVRGKLRLSLAGLAATYSPRS